MLFSFSVQMQFQSAPRTDVLFEDQHRMQHVVQPTLVRQQMSELFANLSKQVSQSVGKCVQIWFIAQNAPRLHRVHV